MYANVTLPLTLVPNKVDRSFSTIYVDGRGRICNIFRMRFMKKEETPSKLAIKVEYRNLQYSLKYLSVMSAYLKHHTVTNVAQNSTDAPCLTFVTHTVTTVHRLNSCSGDLFGINVHVVIQHNQLTSSLYQRMPLWLRKFQHCKNISSSTLTFNSVKLSVNFVKVEIFVTSEIVNL